MFISEVSEVLVDSNRVRLMVPPVYSLHAKLGSAASYLPSRLTRRTKANDHIFQLIIPFKRLPSLLSPACVGRTFLLYVK